MADPEALLEAAGQAKLRACPHCGVCGTLNAHGTLLGYGPAGEHGALRGLRLFCSNRFRRPGCGRTISIQLARFMKHFSIQVQAVWQLAELRIRTLSVAAAWRLAAKGRFSISSGYRIWRRLCASMPAIQTLLLQMLPVPACSHPMLIAQVIAHTKSAFPDGTGPFEDFQLRFQTRLLL